MEPLLLRACENGALGRAFHYEGGAAYEAGFIYLTGAPLPALLSEHMDLWQYRMFICLSDAWRAALFESFPGVNRVKRYQMRARAFSKARLGEMANGAPPEYRVSPFDERAFALHPFGHGANYASFDEFTAVGAGMAAWRDGEIAASASTFLSYQSEAEVDISTSPAHRRRGLAAACGAGVLLLCISRGLRPHWDAQNTASRDLAQKLVYELDYEYDAFTLVPPERFSV